ncbi:hypothetical protein BSKO_10749 [Bryopsis sp. KO-2023]|nr:hypothetical protein BSKO_10749 [Bryopsis sp. KO-2023]
MFQERMLFRGGGGPKLTHCLSQHSALAPVASKLKRLPCLARYSGNLRVSPIGRRPSVSVAKSASEDATEVSTLERPADSVPESSEVGPSPECEGRSLNSQDDVDLPTRVFSEIYPGTLLLSVATGGGLLASSASFLATPASFAEAIGILAIIVAVHEAGHFLAARVQNIHVTKFAIGFGPPLIKYQGPEVEYSIRAFPLGGFVGFPDDDPSSPYPADDPDLFSNRTIPQRALVISAGVLANLLFAFSILFTQATTVGVAKETFEPGVKVTMVFKDSIAEQAGLLPGDMIMGIDERVLNPGPRAVSNVVAEINSHPGDSLPLVIKRDGSPVRISVTPDPGRDGKGRVGMQLESNSRITRKAAEDIGEAVSTASAQFGTILKEMVTGLQQIIFNFSKTSEQVSGPVAIVAVGAEVARLDAAQLFTFAAVINMNLAVVNVLPLPALDGGYLALLILEALRGGKKLPEKVEQGVMASGLVFLMAVGIGLVVRDTVNLGILNKFHG